MKKRMSKKMSKAKKALFGSLTAVAGVGAVAGISVVSINKEPNGSKTIEVDQEIITTSPVENNTTNTNKPSSTTQSVANKVSSDIKMGITRNANESKFVMSISENNKKEGKVYILKDGQQVQSIEFLPGQTVQFKFEPNKGYENYTIRDLKIYGVDTNHFVPTKNVDGSQVLFEVKMPTIEETIDIFTGESWLYGENVKINVIPSFIIGDIGKNNTEVKWEHGVFFESLNGYAFNFDKDMTWSEVEQKYEAFSNDKDIQNPITLYFFLNGHTLTMDKNLSESEINKLAPSGWNLAFYNNGNDTATPDGKFGTIKVTENFGEFAFGGTLTFSNSINYRYVPMSNGIKFLNVENAKKDGWIGDFISNPSKLA